MKNLKDLLTTIAGVMVAFGGTILTLQKTGVVLPESLTTAGAISGTIGMSIGLYMTGKNADGSTKTPAQIEKQLSEK